MEKIRHKVFVTGDVHGGTTSKNLTSKNWKSNNLTKNDFLIVLGDFGLPWECKVTNGVNLIQSYKDVLISKNDLYHIKWFLDKSFTTLVLLGNHEGIYNIWDKLEVRYYEPIKGNIKVLPTIHGEIYYLLRDTLYEINGKTFLVIGGALSIDYKYRTPNKDWWEIETLTEEEKSNIINILDKTRDFDYILSHTCPSEVIPNILGYCFLDKVEDDTAKFLSFIESRIKYKEWHFGHLHVDNSIVVDNSIFYCHYNNKPMQLL